MDGYSVNDAATVLGIPEARVWELIARGVLSGHPEADGGMRVVLKATAPLAAAPPASDEPKRNGNGNGHGFDPFRELLTEFRNLTERYGQALLALGEARGEVASLRSRIEVLEARVDLRLPGARPTSTVAWEMPDLPARPAMPGVPPTPPVAEALDQDEPEAEAAPDVSDGSESAPRDEPPSGPSVDADAIVEPPAVPPAAVEGPRRGRSGRVLTSGFAEALARAQDPTLSDLPGAREAGDALAAFQHEMSAAADVAEPATAPEPLEEVFLDEPVAASPPVLDELVEAEAPFEAEPEVADAAAQPEPSVFDQGPYTTEIAEPDWFADGDFAWPVEPPPPPPSDEPDAAAVEPTAEVEQHDAEPAEQQESDWPTGSAETSAAGPALPDEALAPPDEPAVAVAVEAPFEPPELTLPTAVPMDLPAEPAEPAAGTHEAPEAAVEPEVDREPQAPMGAQELAGFRDTSEVELMWLGDEFEAAELEIAAPGWHSQPPSDDTTTHPSTPVSADPGLRMELSDEQLARLAHDEGWEPSEVDAIRAFLGRSETTVAAAEPALAPAEGAASEPPPPAPSMSVALPVEPVSASGWQPPRPPIARLELPRTAAAGNPDWLRGRRGPAATAYRRLRRLFPG